MRHKRLIILPLLSLGAIAATITIIGLNQSAERIEGYSAPTLPTTIDLNDNTAQEIRSY